MITITFDTHEFVKELKNAGFSEQQAKVIPSSKKRDQHHAGTSQA